MSTLSYLLSRSGQSHAINTHFHIPPSAVSPRRPRAAGPWSGLCAWRSGGCEPEHSELMDSDAPWQGSRHVRARRMRTPRLVIDGQWESRALTKLIIWTNDGSGAGAGWSAHSDTKHAETVGLNGGGVSSDGAAVIGNAVVILDLCRH